MSTIGAFNDMMEQFLNELVLTFPEEKAMKKYSVQFELARVASPRTTMDVFMQGISPYTSMIMAKDEKFFRDHLADIPILEEMNMAACWNDDDLSDSTKDAMWQYLQTLYILGTTINMFNDETLSMIEAAAAKCANEMKNNGGGQLDASAISGMMSMMSNMK
jgi:hypothetical protein